MAGLKGIFERFRPKAYGRRPPLILINGLAEQTESWFRNRRFWSRYFDVFAPNIMIYDGGVIHGRIESKLPVSIEFLVEQLQWSEVTVDPDDWNAAGKAFWEAIGFQPIRTVNNAGEREPYLLMRWNGPR